MNQRTVAGVLAGLSTALIVTELLIALQGGFDPGLMLFALSLFIGLTGLLFALRTLGDSRREVIESVSERRARAKRDAGMSGLLDGYEIDEEFIGRGRASGKPVSSKPAGSPESAGKESSVQMFEEPSIAGGHDESPSLSISIDKESFDDYIRRCMSEPGTCIDDEESEPGYAVDLDADDLSARPGTPPTDFSHDPKAIMSRLNQPDEKG
jgi:hypothetical protein